MILEITEAVPGEGENGSTVITPDDNVMATVKRYTLSAAQRASEITEAELRSALPSVDEGARRARRKRPRGAG